MKVFNLTLVKITFLMCLLSKHVSTSKEMLRKSATTTNDTDDRELFAYPEAESESESEWESEPNPGPAPQPAPQPIGNGKLSKTWLPEESSPHQGTWLQWPHPYEYGNAYRKAIEPTWVSMTKGLVASEKVNIIVYDNSIKSRAQRLLTEAGVSLKQQQSQLLYHPNKRCMGSGQWSNVCA